jgi:hypothetical protein
MAQAASGSLDYPETMGEVHEHLFGTSSEPDGSVVQEWYDNVVAHSTQDLMSELAIADAAVHGKKPDGRAHDLVLSEAVKKHREAVRQCLWVCESL